MEFKKLHKNIHFNSTLIKAKVMNALGSTPNKIDDFMLIADNEIFGTIGGGTLEFQVINESKKLLINNKKENILLMSKDANGRLANPVASNLLLGSLNLF